MSPIARLLQPLRKAASAFFQHDVALRRSEGAVRVVLEERGPGKGTRPPSRQELADRKEKAELALMREQLAELLGELPDTRQALRHLVFVEQALARKGLRALHKLPLDVLQHALDQLEGLITNWSPEGLANLRSKMAVAIIDREHMDPDAEADAYRTAAVLDGGPDSLPQAAADLGLHAGPEVTESMLQADDDALAAAYAALGVVATAPAPARMPQLPTRDTALDAPELQSELGSPSAKSAAREAARPAARAGNGGSGGNGAAADIRLRELQS